MKRQVVIVLMILSTMPACGGGRAAIPVKHPVAKKETVEPVVAKRDDKYDQLMFMAIENYSSTTADTLKSLLEKGADVNARDENGNTALILATEHDHSDLVKFLLAAGADFDIQNKQGRTASYLAAKLGREEISLMIRETKMKRYDLIFNVP